MQMQTLAAPVPFFAALWRSSAHASGAHTSSRSQESVYGACATDTSKEWSRVPSGEYSVIDSSKVSLWFALRAAVLRLAVSPLWTVALYESCGVAAGLTHRQNSSMVNRLAARLVAHIGLRPRRRRGLSCCIAAGPAVRANPSLKRTRTGMRAAWPLSLIHI